MLFLNYLHRLNGSHCRVSMTCVCLNEIFFLFEILFHFAEMKMLHATEISKDKLVANVSKTNKKMLDANC